MNVVKGMDQAMKAMDLEKVSARHLMQILAEPVWSEFRC
jgi:hypothetical protein